MTVWNIKYLDSIEPWLDKLTKQQLKFVAKELKLLELCGNKLKLPHSRPLGGGLFELRERRFGLRVYYTFLDDQIILLLLAGDKSSQKQAIKIAKKLINKLKGGSYES